jgi:ABC-type glutathione transport system ATPase component
MDGISEIDSISAKYAVDRAAAGSALPEPVIGVRGLVKRYGSHDAVAGIDLEVRRGEIFAVRKFSWLPLGR